MTRRTRIRSVGSNKTKSGRYPAEAERKGQCPIDLRYQVEHSYTTYRHARMFRPNTQAHCDQPHAPIASGGYLNRVPRTRLQGARLFKVGDREA
jgi:hypothetical protein